MVDIFKYVNQLLCFHQMVVFLVDNTNGLKSKRRCKKCLMEEK